MRELINMARVQGLYRGKHISSISNSWKITVRHKYHCICECICETFQITDAREAESCVYYNGAQQFKWNHITFIAVGYEICTRYIDSENHKKTITNQGNALFFNPANDYNYLLRIPNPPACKVLKNKVITEFPIVVAFRST
jgi:hypothetical protein